MLHENTQTNIEISSQDLPLSCPMPAMQTWNSHPRVFLKIEKPSVIHGKGQYIWSVIDKKGSPDLFFDEYTPKSFDGIVFRDVIDFNGALGSKYVLDISDIYMVRKNTQIKLADGTNTTFDPTNDDIRFKDGGSIDNERIDCQKCDWSWKVVD